MHPFCYAHRYSYSMLIRRPIHSSKLNATHGTHDIITLHNGLQLRRELRVTFYGGSSREQSFFREWGIVAMGASQPLFGSSAGLCRAGDGVECVGTVPACAGSAHSRRHHRGKQGVTLSEQQGMSGGERESWRGSAGGALEGATWLSWVNWAGVGTRCRMS